MDQPVSIEALESALQADASRRKDHVRIAENGCWEWIASRTPLGYGQVRFRGTRELAHRVSWIVFNGEIPGDKSKYGTSCILHQCDNPPCVNPAHLFVGTQRENANDSIGKGRWGKRGCKGERHGRAVLSESDVKAIRASQQSTRELATEFKVSQSAIVHIKNRRTWSHI